MAVKQSWAWALTTDLQAGEKTCQLFDLQKGHCEGQPPLVKFMANTMLSAFVLRQQY